MLLQQLIIVIKIASYIKDTSSFYKLQTRNTNRMHKQQRNNFQYSRAEEIGYQSNRNCKIKHKKSSQSAWRTR